MKSIRPDKLLVLFNCLVMLLVSNVFAPAWSAETKVQGIQGIRGTFFDFVDDPWKHVGHDEEAARFYEDGLLVVDNGIIKAFGPYSEVSAQYPGIKVTNIPNRIIVPGFIDGHGHFPQCRVLGEFGLQLLPWLQKWIYPEETKYKNPSYAAEGIRHYFDYLLAAGTTTIIDYGSTFPNATEAYFDEATRRNMRVLTGLQGIDRACPPGFGLPPEQFYTESKRLIEKYHGKGRNLYATSLRFAYGCTPQLMEKFSLLHKEYPDIWVNTHVCENPTETRDSAALFGVADYLGCYEKYGLVGPKFVAGHGVQLSDDEYKRLSKAGASVSFCANSNMFLGNGLFRLGKAKDPENGVRLIFGADVAGGNSFSMLNVLNQSYKVGMVNATRLDGSIDHVMQDDAQSERNKLNAYRAFYSLTLGGANGLYLDDKIGNFEPGKEADFVALDWIAGPPWQPWHQSLICDKPTTKDQAAELLFGVMSVGDERAVDETWVMGRRLYKRSQLAVASTTNGNGKYSNTNGK